MTVSVRTGLIAAFASAVVACGGGGSSPPPPPPPPPPMAGVNAPPTFTSPTAVTARENAIGVVYRPVATDPEGATIAYGGVIGGPDAARFTINPTTREVRFVAQPDFEAPADVGANNVYDISFTASDGATTVTQNVAISVANVAAGFRVRRVSSSLSAPIFAAGLPDGTGRIVVVERAGRIRVMTPATGAIAATDFLNISSEIDTSGEKGLLAIAFSPNFLTDRTFYLHLNPLASNTTEIRRYTTLATAFDQALSSSGDVIMSVAQPAGLTNHKGGMLAFDASGRLLIGLGDGGGGGDPQNSGQTTTTLLGKLLRIDVSTDAFPADAARDYAIPTVNPFATTGGLPEIWAMGLRNPFRGSVDPVTGDVFIGDVGQGAIEEVDRIPRASTGLLNFGWNRREGSQAYNGGADSPSFLLPVTEYAHGSSAIQGNSITGGVVYRGPVEDLQALYIFGDFVRPNIWSVPIANLNPGAVLPSSAYTVRNTSFTPDAGTIANVSAFANDTDGNLYILDLAGGEVFIVEPVP